MTARPKTALWISPEEYLEGELRSEVRHEYIEGSVFAMAGGSRDHNRISGNLVASLKHQLGAGPCEVFINDFKLKASPSSELFYYPDVMVACDPTDRHDYFCERPAIIFEILSPTTELIDRREKMLVYKSIPSVQAYVLVEQERIHVTVHRRTEKGWAAELLDSRGQTLDLPAVRAKIPLDSIYEGTNAAKQ